MTTEIAILNRSAVALATDSAVTISSSEGGPRIHKIYANANKLFELVKGRPVGIMIYNSADVAGIPWETLVKAFRSSGSPTKRNYLTEYVDDFLSFVNNVANESLSDEESAQALVEQIGAIALSLLRSLERVVLPLGKKVERRKQIIQLLKWFSAELDGRPDPDWSRSIDEREVWADAGERVMQSLPDECGGATLTLTAKRLLARTALKFLLRGSEPPPGPWSGVVIAGFGEKELFPSLFEVKIAGIARRRLVRLDPSVRSVSPSQPAIIKPYAQTSEAVMFLQGVDPEISEGIREFWSEWTGRIHSDFVTIAKSVAPITKEQTDELVERTRQYVQESWKQFDTYMNGQFYQPRMEPIEGSAAFLSKGEIADLAENLVELTSLRNRVSLDRQETVGGATDVAVISKGDGFVWIKRKHYFERDRNPSWGMRQALADVLLVQSRREDGRGDALDQ